MRIIGIDPGNIETAFVEIDENYKIIDFAKDKNDLVMSLLKKDTYDYLFVESITSYGQIVGQTVFETIFWYGRYYEAISAKTKVVIPRRDIKKHLCGGLRAGDKDVRKTLIDRFATFDFINGKGKKQNPDFFFGVAYDVWSAIAVAVVGLDRLKGV